jgi:hypothetical protein
LLKYLEPAVFLFRTAAAVAIVLTVGLGAGFCAETDSVRANTAWKGEIRQGARAFPATIQILARNGNRIRGEIDFVCGSNRCELTFQGDVVDATTVVWITGKKAGPVTVPGLYFGKVDGKRLSGTWQVPTAGQYDHFSVQLQ